MRKIVYRPILNDSRIIDHLHIQKLANEAVQELRIRHHWDAIQESNNEIEHVNHTFLTVSRLNLSLSETSSPLPPKQKRSQSFD